MSTYTPKSNVYIPYAAQRLHDKADEDKAPESEGNEPLKQNNPNKAFKQKKWLEELSRPITKGEVDSNNIVEGNHAIYIDLDAAVSPKTFKKIATQKYSRGGLLVREGKPEVDADDADIELTDTIDNITTKVDQHGNEYTEELHDDGSRYITYIKDGSVRKENQRDRVEKAIEINMQKEIAEAVNHNKTTGLDVHGCNITTESDIEYKRRNQIEEANIEFKKRDDTEFEKEIKRSDERLKRAHGLEEADAAELKRMKKARLRGEYEERKKKRLATIYGKPARW